MRSSITIWPLLAATALLWSACSTRPSAACKITDPRAELGLQIVNTFDERLRVTVVASDATGTTRLVLLDGERIPGQRRVADPSLGGTPEAMPIFVRSLPSGTWTIEVRDETHGTMAAIALPERTGDTWLIAWVAAGLPRLTLDSGPRRLE